MFIEIPITLEQDYDIDDPEDTVRYSVKIFKRRVFSKTFDVDDRYYYDAEEFMDEVKDEFANKLQKLLAQ